MTIHTANRKQKPRGAWTKRALRKHNTHQAVFAMAYIVRQVADFVESCMTQVGENMAAFADALAAFYASIKVHREAQP